MLAEGFKLLDLGVEKPFSKVSQDVIVGLSLRSFSLTLCHRVLVKRNIVRRKVSPSFPLGGKQSHGSLLKTILGCRVELSNCQFELFEHNHNKYINWSKQYICINIYCNLVTYSLITALITNTSNFDTSIDECPASYVHVYKCSWISWTGAWAIFL